MNRVEVIERMEPALNTQVKEIDHNPKTRVVVTPEMVTFKPGGGQHSLEMTESGVQGLAKFVGLPWNIASQLHPASFGAVANDLLERKQRYSLVVKDQRVTGVVKRGHYHTINPERALRAVEAGVPGIEFHRVMILDDLVVNIEVIGEKREPVSRGDLVQAGASVTFSPMGTVDPSVMAFALRLVCTNGQTHNHVLREFHWGGGGGSDDGGDVWQWFRRSTRDAYNALNPIVERYRQMMQEEVTPADRAMILEAMLREAKITGEAANAVRAMAIENPPQTSYDIMNLITNASSHLLSEPKQVIRARKAIETYTDETSHARVCPVCHSRRN